ncbi:hypothetical protein ACFS07_08235 [Undibacterium arcticum]
MPNLLRGTSAGRPRVYDIALETISHGDGRVDPESLSRFVAAYQQVTTLKLGELWAIPIMLRLALIENLRRVAARLATTRHNRNQADAWADEMAETAETEPSNLILLVADMARSSPPMDSSFVAELVRRLQGQSPALTLPLTWLSQHLAESGQTIEQLVQFDTQQQAADQVSISNSIGSLRFLSAMDWREFVENMSMVDHALRKDPADTYTRMDFATRDHYRHVVEKNCQVQPPVRSRRRRQRDPASQRQCDAGWCRRPHQTCWLLSGRQWFAGIGTRGGFPLAATGSTAAHGQKLAVGYLSWQHTVADPGRHRRHRCQGLCRRRARMVARARRIDRTGRHQPVCAIHGELACHLDHDTASAPAHGFFSDGIPPESRTLVVVPTMLFTKQNIDSLSEALEIRFLANRDDNLRFWPADRFRRCRNRNDANR